MFNHISILLSSDINIGCHVTLWSHDSTSMRHPGISSSKIAVKFELTPEILLDKRYWLMMSSLSSRDPCVFYRLEIIFVDNMKNLKMISSINLGISSSRFTCERFKLISQLQSWPKYMRQTLLLVWNSALREDFSFNFWTVFRFYWQNFHFGRKTGH